MTLLEIFENLEENEEIHRLTEDERKIVMLLADAFILFKKLPNKHPSDDEEFARYIHILQRHVMSKPTRRNHPDLF
jgi:hypothetical protein